MIEEILIGTGEINGKEHYCFSQSERGMIFFKAIFDGIEHLVKKEESFKNVKSTYNHETTVVNDITFIVPTKFTIQDKDSGVEKVLEGEVLQNKLTFILNEQNKKQERLAEMENKISLLNLEFDEERKILLDYLIADEKEQEEQYAKFLAEVEYYQVTLRYSDEKKGIVIYIDKSLLEKLKELNITNINFDEEDYVTTQEATDEATFETFRKICNFFDFKTEDTEEKVKWMKEFMGKEH